MKRLKRFLFVHYSRICNQLLLIFLHFNNVVSTIIDPVILFVDFISNQMGSQLLKLLYFFFIDCILIVKIIVANFPFSTFRSFRTGEEM
jgi:hypothetical protein